MVDKAVDSFLFWWFYDQDPGMPNSGFQLVSASHTKIFWGNNGWTENKKLLYNLVCQLITQRKLSRVWVRSCCFGMGPTCCFLFSPNSEPGCCMEEGHLGERGAVNWPESRSWLLSPRCMQGCDGEEGRRLLLGTLGHLPIPPHWLRENHEATNNNRSSHLWKTYYVPGTVVGEVVTRFNCPSFTWGNWGTRNTWRRSQN